MSNSLYQINEQILETIDFETGEVADFEKFEALKLEMETKIENVALWYKNLLSDAEALKAEEKAFNERRKSVESKAESLKRYLDSALNGNKFNTTRVAISYRKSTSVFVEDLDKLPKEYKKEKIDISADKTELAKALKDGKEIEGASLTESQNIQIK